MSSDEEESSSFNSPELKVKRSPPASLGQSLLAVTINIMKGRVALFPKSEVGQSYIRFDSNGTKNNLTQCH